MDTEMGGLRGRFSYAGVQCAGREGTDGYVGNELALDGVRDKPVHMSDGVYQAIGMGLGGKAPVPLGAQAVRVESQKNRLGATTGY